MTSHTIITLWAFALLVCTLLLLAWSCVERFIQPDTEGRAFGDAPPLLFRILWWPIGTLTRRLQRLPLDLGRAALPALLQQAGLEFRLSASQFTAGRLVCSWLLLNAGALVAWGLSARALLSPSSPFLMVAGLCVLPAAMGWLLPRVWLGDRLKRRQHDILRAMPFYLDIITLCVEAGLSVQGAIAQAVTKGPQGHVRDEFQRVLRDVRSGKGRSDALRAMAGRLNERSVTTFVSCVVQADRMGMSLGPMLRSQAEQRLNERFNAAEKKALQAPVKMIFPLALFIFPCTFIVLLFPVAVKLLGAT